LSLIDKNNSTSIIMKLFGKFLRKIRLDNNLTLTQMGAKIGIDSANLSKIENGKRDFDEKKIVILSKEFNISINEIKKEYYSEKIAKIIYKEKDAYEFLKLAETKVKYFKSINVKQSKIEL